MLEQQLMTQAAEIAAAGHAGWGNTMQDAAAELAALRKDAERYRWLREHSTEYSLTQKDGYGGRELLGWDELDAAVDAAMAAPPAVGAA